MSHIETTAPAEEIQDYTQGQCHIFAVALHRRYGWPILIVENYEQPFWEDPEDSDNFIPSVLHTYAVDPSGVAWDIRGGRPSEEAIRDCADFFCESQSGLSTDTVPDEASMKHLVGYWGDDDCGPIERPLCEFSDEDVDRAAKMIDLYLAPILSEEMKPDLSEAPSPNS